MKEKRHEVMKMKTYTVFSIAGLIIVTLLIGGTASANSGGFGSFSGAMMGGFRPFLIWRIVMWIVVLGVIGVIVWLIVRTQNDQGGWRYQPVKYDADLSVTICQIMALRAALGSAFCRLTCIERSSW